MNGFVHAVCKCSQKVAHTRSGIFRPISMSQPLAHDSVALVLLNNYETGMEPKVFH